MSRTLLRPIVAFVAVVCVVLLTYATAYASSARPLPGNNYDDEIAAAEKKKADLEQQEEELDHLLEGTAADLVEANARLRELNTQLPEAQRALDLAQERAERARVQLELAQAELDAAQADADRISAQIEADEQRIAELRQLVAALARAAYRGENAHTTLQLVFGTTTTEEFVDEVTLRSTLARTQGNALAELDQLAAANRNLGVKLEAIRVEAERLREEAAALAEEREQALAEAQAKADEIEANLAEQKELTDYLKSQEKRFLQDLEDNQREQVQTQFELAKLARQSIEDGLEFPDGEFLAPVSSIYVTSPYGYRVHPIYGVRIFHAGVDLRAYCGTPIKATTWGIVTHAKWAGGYGNQVLVNHGTINGKGYASTYNHLSRFNVGAGDIVAPGDVVGYSGTTGNSVGCHLHFEILINGKFTDPMDII